MARVVDRLSMAVLAQRGGLFPFVPVMLACGIGVYFALRVEPLWWVLAGCAGLGCAGLWGMRWCGPLVRAVLCAVSLAALGFALAGARAHWVAGPVMADRFYGPVMGRVVAMDRSASDAMRVTLDQVWVAELPAAQTPTRVRISLHGAAADHVPAPGDVVLATTHLGPPGGAVEPGGFDFRRHAWFLQLGGVGYTRVPVVTWSKAERGQWVFRLRMAVSERVQAALPGETGGFAAAIMAGDRSAIHQEVLEDLRDTNLAHLLAISGLHMGLLSGFVFAVLRLGLVLTPVGLIWPIKKIAAVGALVAAAGYLTLSGGNVATERAFVMVAVMLGAILCDQRAISLRAVAMAAVIVLCLRPEALLGPGFQMSFAATTALVAVFTGLRDTGLSRATPWWAQGALSVFLSSAIAGAATAPVAMAHFNQMSQFGLLANLASVPLMGVLVMPALVLAAVLMPLGLEFVGLWVASLGLEWILTVAHAVADWSGTVRPIPAPPSAVLPMLALGAVFVVVWQGWGRVLGVLPMGVAVAIWMMSERPMVLIAEGGKLVGVMTEAGRALSRERGSGFVAGVWLENDGQGLDQAASAALWSDGARVGEYRLRHVHGKRGLAGYAGCGAQSIVVSNMELPQSGACLVFDAVTLAGLGSVALYPESDGTVRVVTSAERTGTRLWATHPGIKRGSDQ